MLSTKIEDKFHNTFICYRHSDGLPWAILLKDTLVRLGYRPFLDVNINQSGDFPEILEKKVKSCIDFVVVVTPDAFGERIHERKDWVEQEIELALKLNKNIVPCKMPMANMPIITSLPKEIQTFADKQCISPDFHTAMDENIRLSVLRDNLGTYLKSMPTKNNKKGSSYELDSKEKIRLSKQVKNTAYLKDIVTNVAEKINRTDLTVLDVGCAEGELGKICFANNLFSKIIGVDKDKAVIKAIKVDDKRFVYDDVDIEDDSAAQTLESIMHNQQVNKFDIVFASMVLHHLLNVEKIMHLLQQFLKPDGYIIVVGPDDGSKLAYGDNDEDGLSIIQQIIEKTRDIPFASDRFNGRKLFYWLATAGFSQIRIESVMRDTSSLRPSEKMDLFDVCFSYRPEMVRLAEKKGFLDKESANAMYNEMKLLCDELKFRFKAPQFWFCSYDYIGIAQNAQ